MSNHPAISVCMIVKNEETNLPRLLASIRGLADEVIVVDTGSTDRTVEIAKSFGAKTYHFEWCDDFSAARNESLKYATGDYILWLDGDDEISEQDHPAIKEHLLGHPGSAVYLKVVSIAEEGPTEAMQLRMFPNLKGLAFSGKVHEQIHDALAEKGVPFTGCHARVTHFGYHTREALEEKLKRNKAIHEKELEENPNNLHSLFFAARALKGLNEVEEALEYMEKVLVLGNESRDRDVLMVTVVDMADALCKFGRDGEAISLLERWKTPLKNPPLLGYTLGELYFKGRDYGKAYVALAPLKNEKFENEIVPLLVGGTRFTMLRDLGVSALFAGDLTLAEECFTNCLEMDDQNDEAWHYLSLTKERNSDMKGAVEVCRKGLATIKDNGFLKKRLFLSLIRNNEPEQALKEYDGLNGQKDKDLEVMAGMFHIHCIRLDMDGINRFYSLIRRELSLSPDVFPEGLDRVRKTLPLLGEAKAGELFESGISHLLRINP